MKFLAGINFALFLQVTIGNVSIKKILKWGKNVEKKITSYFIRCSVK